MGNTTVFKGTTVTITPDGSTDWDWQTETEIPVELRAHTAVLGSIQMHAGAQNERIKFRDGGADGIIFLELYSPAATPMDKIKYFHDKIPKERRRIFIKSDDCTWSSSTRIIIELL